MNFQAERKSLKGAVLIACPSCDRKMPEGSYVCAHCRRENDYRSKTPPLMASEPEFVPKSSGRDAGCHSCGKERRLECHQRMRDGYWLACERADLLDFLIVGLVSPEDAKDYAGGVTVNTWSRKKGKVNA